MEEISRFFLVHSVVKDALKLKTLKIQCYSMGSHKILCSCMAPAKMLGKIKNKNNNKCRKRKKKMIKNKETKSKQCWISFKLFIWSCCRSVLRHQGDGGSTRWSYKTGDEDEETTGTSKQSKPVMYHIKKKMYLYKKEIKKKECGWQCQRLVLSSSTKVPPSCDSFSIFKSRLSPKLLYII